MFRLVTHRHFTENNVDETTEDGKTIITSPVNNPNASQQDIQDFLDLLANQEEGKDVGDVLESFLASSPKASNKK